MIIWGSVQRCIAAALASAEAAAGCAIKVVGLGITNQRETTVLWSRSTGQPLHNAIVWLDNRTRCARCCTLTSSGMLLLVLFWFACAAVTVRRQQ
jgi:glycerol kinase